MVGFLKLEYKLEGRVESHQSTSHDSRHMTYCLVPAFKIIFPS